MFIGAQPPFELTNEPDGTKHAIKDDIQITVLPDVGDVELKHRVGQQTQGLEQSRWLYGKLGELRLYVNGTHVIITKKEMIPTFNRPTIQKTIQDIFKHIKPAKNKRGEYVIENEKNVERLAEFLTKLIEYEKFMARRQSEYIIQKALES